MSKMPNVLAKSTQGYGYKYTELAEINKALGEAGMSYRQYVEPLVAGESVIDYIFTILVDEKGEESEPIRGCRIVGGGVGKNAAQDQGAAITYARRYSLMMALGLACEDDDAANLSSKPTRQPKQASAPAKGRGIDFQDLNTKVNACKSVDDLNKLWAAEFGNRLLSPKQKDLVTNIFAGRKADLKDPLPTDEELEAFDAA